MVYFKIRSTLSTSIVGTCHDRTCRLMKFTGTLQLSHILALGLRIRKSHLCFSYMYHSRAGNIVTLLCIHSPLFPANFCSVLLLCLFCYLKSPGRHQHGPAVSLRTLPSVLENVSKSILKRTALIFQRRPGWPERCEEPKVLGSPAERSMILLQNLLAFSTRVSC